jgi:hypothetical protein
MPEASAVNSPVSSSTVILPLVVLIAVKSAA